MAGKNGREYRKAKHQFRPSYCVKCLQNRVCEEFQFAEGNICCPCRVAKEKSRSTLRDYQKLLNEWQTEHTNHRNYLRVQAQDPKTWQGWQKGYQKQGGIDITWGLQTYNGTPGDLECVAKGKQDPRHVFCDCAARQAREGVADYTQKLAEYQQRLKNCRCVPHPKTRTDAEGTTCESCGKELRAANNMRIIKNRNDPRFGGLKVAKKILCLLCLKKKYYGNLVKGKRRTLNKYLQREYA